MQSVKDKQIKLSPSLSLSLSLLLSFSLSLSLSPSQSLSVFLFLFAWLCLFLSTYLFSTLSLSFSSLLISLSISHLLKTEKGFSQVSSVVSVHRAPVILWWLGGESSFPKPSLTLSGALEVAGNRPLPSTAKPPRGTPSLWASRHSTRRQAIAEGLLKIFKRMCHSHKFDNIHVG